MLSLDIATVQPTLQNHLVPLRAQTLIQCNSLQSTWKSSWMPTIVNIYAGNHYMRRGKLLITAVATLEPKSLVQNGREKNNQQLDASSSPSSDEHTTSTEKSEEVDERERLRRFRISKANRGNTPWNKGRKHSAETRQRIRERTRLAMQDPKVKMKLINFGHAQSQDTREKIGVGVRIGWERRRVRLMVQESCFFEWQNLIAEASRRGYDGEEVLEWDSYMNLDKQLTQEWLESVEQRKSSPRPKGSKRAPKSPEQRRKIAEAISAKWADPTYRDRVCSALAKYHGIPAVGERKTKRKSNSSTDTTRQSHRRKNISDNKSETRSPIERFKKSNTPHYKDPLASSKLEMIKNIRAQRVAAESKKIEAIERARQLIAEAEKAAKALEVAALKNSIAQASLIETRKLIAEATKSIESIEMGQISPNGNSIYPSVTSSELEDGVSSQENQREVNGTKVLSSSEIKNLSFANLPMQGIVNGDKILPPTPGPTRGRFDFPTFDLDGRVKKTASTNQHGSMDSTGHIKWENNPQPNGSKVQQMEFNGDIKCANNHLPNGIVLKEEIPSKPVTVTKKWVCGRLVEVTEEG